MLDELISLILSLPNLKQKLSNESFKTFFIITNEIGYKITEASFEDYLKKHPDISFGFIIEKPNILTYLRIWPFILAELNFFIKLHGIAWYEKYKEGIAADDLVPLLTAYMPKDNKTLNEFVAQLEVLTSIDSAAEPCCYLTSFAIAALSKIEELKPIDIQLADLQGVPVAEEKHALTFTDLRPEKHVEHIEKIKNEPIYLYLLSTVIKLAAYTNDAQHYHQAQTYSILHNLNIHSYDVVEANLSEEHLAYLTSAQITDMFSNLDKEPFHCNAKLIYHIEKYIAYHDLHDTLEDLRSRTFRRLYTFTMKVNQIYQRILSDDLAACMFDTPVNIATFLALPAEKTWGPALFSTAHKTRKVLLKDFMDALTMKMDELEEVRVKIRTKSDPPPPQFTIVTDTLPLNKSM